MSDLADTEATLTGLLDSYRDRLVDSTIYNMASLAWPGAKKHDYFAAVKRNNSAVSLYLLPIDRHPDLLATASPRLQKAKSGKVTFGFKTLDDELTADLRGLLDALMERYAAEHSSGASPAR